MLPEKVELMEAFRIGLDLGGTKVLAILSDHRYTVLRSEKRPLAKPVTVTTVRDVLVDLFQTLAAGLPRDQIQSAGLAVPGPVNPQTGMVFSMPNLGLKNVNIKKLLARHIFVPLKVGNDVNLAAWAEYHLGAGRGSRSLFAFYPGTGVGGGYIQDGKLITGFNHTAAEVGHMVVEVDGALCGCGQQGCLETIVSKRGFERMFREADRISGPSAISGKNTFTTADLVTAWNQKDPVVCGVLKEQARILGIAVANVVNITGVERVIIGGEIYHQLPEGLMPIVRSTAGQYAIGNGMQGVKICLNALGDKAPALGAVLL